MDTIYIVLLLPCVQRQRIATVKIRLLFFSFMLGDVRLHLTEFGISHGGSDVNSCIKAKDAVTNNGIYLLLV
jgi:hypothetical protein